MLNEIKQFQLDQINITARQCSIGNELIGGCSVYYHILRYESESIRVFDDEKKCWYFTPPLYVMGVL